LAVVSPPERAARLLALVVPLALLVGAYISELGFGLYPCEMCWWQRYAHFGAVALALLAFAGPLPRFWTALAALAIAASAAIGAFHAGVEYGWWPGLTACSVTLAAEGKDPLAAVLDAPLVRCDVAPWTLAGVSLAGWNFLFSLAGVLVIALLLVKGRGLRDEQG
jgi:disulfide bond formation protein DsbB